MPSLGWRTAVDKVQEHAQAAGQLGCALLQELGVAHFDKHQRQHSGHFQQVVHAARNPGNA